ncbi:MAG: alpha/beta hydrolase [Saccharospirillaceae bacterium]|nr:alpha/beta hydrolase [Pseudomonadales bacterium]NRB80272.1 alpha/beta hydrolase [Saccharospirillaceae bacterium]
MSDNNKSAQSFTVTHGISSNITYAVVDGIEIKLDVIMPRENLGGDPWWKMDAELKPTLIFFHGGGWESGDKSESVLQLLPFIEKGWVVVNANYRLADVAKAPAAVFDCRQVLQWVKNNAETYQIDLNNVVVSGESSGGHLALMSCLTNKSQTLLGEVVNENSPNIKAIINWFGVTDLTEPVTHTTNSEIPQWIPTADNLESVITQLSPTHYVDKNTPAVISIHGTADEVVLFSQAQILHKKLDAHQVRNVLLPIEGKAHGNFSSEDFALAYEKIWMFLSVDD